MVFWGVAVHLKKETNQHWECYSIFPGRSLKINFNILFILSIHFVLPVYYPNERSKGMLGHFLELISAEAIYLAKNLHLT